MSNTDSTTKSPILEVFLSTNTGPRSTIFVLNKSYGFQGAYCSVDCLEGGAVRGAGRVPEPWICDRTGCRERVASDGTRRP